MSRDIIQDYIIEKSPNAVFDALITPGMSKKWKILNR